MEYLLVTAYGARRLAQTMATEFHHKPGFSVKLQPTEKQLLADDGDHLFMFRFHSRQI